MLYGLLEHGYSIDDHPTYVHALERILTGFLCPPVLPMGTRDTSYYHLLLSLLVALTSRVMIS
jgi:hypothetical protein